MKASPHRPTKALIHLGAIRQNIQQMGAHIPQGTLKFAVVKANAYGHGAVAVATAIQDDVDWFLRFRILMRPLNSDRLDSARKSLF